MLQLIAYMIAAYGIARLCQTSKLGGESFSTIAGAIGIAALALLAVLVTRQADTIGNLGL